MKLRTFALVSAIALAAILSFAQTPPAAAPKPDPNEVAVKDSPASQSLAQLAKDQAADRKHLNDIFQQARTSLDQNSKALNESVAAAQKDLNDKLNADKHYKPLLDHLKDLQKQMQDAGQKAQAGFQNSVQPIQQKLNVESAQIAGLEPVVRKENNLPDTAVFNAATGKWSVPKAAEKK